MRNSLGLVLRAMWVPVLTTSLGAQSTPPTTYSYTEDPAIVIIAPSVIKLSRDGAKEVVDQVIPVSEGRPKEFHQHVVYDFQAHKIYTKLLSDASVPCSVMDYASPAAPPEFDIISGAGNLMQELTDSGKMKPKQTGTETLNGVATKVVEIAVPMANQGHMKVWLAASGNYPVKVVAVAPDGTPSTIIEMKQLSLAKPPAADFTPPTGCQQLQGQSTASGGHVEVGGSPSTVTTKVTAVQLQPIPVYTGACPAHVRMVGTITTDGPGTVWYQFGAGKLDPADTVTFTAAGTKTVTHVMTFTLDPKFGTTIGASALLQAVVQDQQGNHGGTPTASNNADFSVNCQAAAH